METVEDLELFCPGKVSLVILPIDLFTIIKGKMSGNCIKENENEREVMQHLKGKTASEVENMRRKSNGQEDK